MLFRFTISINTKILNLHMLRFSLFFCYTFLLDYLKFQQIPVVWFLFYNVRTVWSLISYSRINDFTVCPFSDLLIISSFWFILRTTLLRFDIFTLRTECKARPIQRMRSSRPYLHSALAFFFRGTVPDNQIPVNRESTVFVT